MNRLSHLAPALLAVPLLAGLTACDDGAAVEAEVYQDGMVELSELGAFEVTLWNEAGDVDVGMNTFWIRVAMPNPADPEDEGQGIPNADVDLVAWMPNAAVETSAVPTITYVSDGVYRIDELHIARAGVWQLDLDLGVGSTIEDQVTFAFTVLD